MSGLSALSMPSHVQDISALPSLGSLYVRAGVPGFNSLASALGRLANNLPVGKPSHVNAPAVDVRASAVRVSSVQFDANKVAEYSELLGFPQNGRALVPYVHVVAFPLAMHLMTQPSFPLRTMGMVHLSNVIESISMLPIDAIVDFVSWVGDFRAHHRGTTVDIIVEARVSDVTVWRGVSTYLSKGEYLEGKSDAPTPPADFTAPFPTSVWSLPASIGRQYATVSGDVNPIHLSALTAKALGFPRALAHGMYTAARVFAQSHPLTPEHVRWSVDFAKPVLLPATVHVNIEPCSPLPDEASGEEKDPANLVATFVGWNARKKLAHFTGSIADIS